MYNPERNFDEIDKNQTEIFQENIEGDRIDSIVLSYENVLNLLENYEQFGILYHGTSSKDISRQVLPPDTTQVISEMGRKKNLSRIFMTHDFGSAEIYAKRAANSYGGKPRILKVVPFGDVEVLNGEKGTTVFHSPMAVVLSKSLLRILSDFKSTNGSAGSVPTETRQLKTLEKATPHIKGVRSQPTRPANNKKL